MPRKKSRASKASAVLRALLKPQYAKLNVFKFGLAGGIITAICVFITTVGAIYGYFTTSVVLIADIYGFLGYDASWFGAILGAIYSFIDAFILTIIFAWVYNKLL